MADDNQNCSSKSKSMHEEVAYRQIEEKSHDFLRKLYPFIRDYQGQLPNLRDIFQPDAIDWILKESVKEDEDSIIDFVINTGYKDEPKVDEDGQPILDRITPIYLVDPNEESTIVSKLFQIYDRFDVNYANEDGITHFHLACRFGCEDEVVKFLEAGQDPNCLTKVGDSPLHYALHGEHKNVAELLLRNGADPTLANAWGTTPLHIICENGLDEDFIKMILELCNDQYQPVQINAQDGFGRTPLQLAMEAIENCKKLVECLLKNGADPNLANAKGSTPLHIGIENNFYAIDSLEVLFKITDEKNQLVQVDAQDEKGRTPLQLAVAYRLPDVVDILLDRGADLSSFVFPAESDFRLCFKRSFYGSRFELASGALAVVERLEKRGYTLVPSDAQTIMKLLATNKVFRGSEDVNECWSNDEDFAIQAKKLLINSSLSLYDASQLRPEEAAKQVTIMDCFEFSKSYELKRLPHVSREPCIAHLCEVLSRKFSQRWTLDFV